MRAYIKESGVTQVEAAEKAIYRVTGSLMIRQPLLSVRLIKGKSSISIPTSFYRSESVFLLLIIVDRRIREGVKEKETLNSSKRNSKNLGFALLHTTTTITTIYFQQIL